MNLNSFRLKMALLSGLITAVLLVGSGFILWRISYQFNLDRLDREIRNLGQANLDRVQGPDHWVRLEDALRFVAGDRPSTPYVLCVQNYDQVIYQSPAWPRSLVPESFPVPAHYEGPNKPVPGEPLPPPPRRGEQISPQNPALPLKSPEFFTREADGKTWRIGVLGNPYVNLVLCADMGDFKDRMAALGSTYLLTMLAVLVLVGASAWLIASRALRPVTALTYTAERVTARGLNQRIPAMTHEQEFNRLVTVFNEMMARLEKSFQQATRFSADASHELKTPLARLQIELEQALESASPDSPDQEVFASLLEEVSRLKSIVQKLLLLSLADAGQLKLQLETVNLTSLMQNIVEDCQAQAPKMAIEEDIAPDIAVMADSNLLEQALQNLASNAVKYNVQGGKIRFELKKQDGHAVVQIANTGPGIPSAMRRRVFERFFRVDLSRDQKTEGVGLGLNLSREIVRSMGGDLALEDDSEGLTRFSVTLPIQAKPLGT